MTHISGFERSQILLLPEAVDGRRRAHETPGREDRGARQAPGFEEDRLQQSGGMPCLSSSVAVHHRSSSGLASGERGGARLARRREIVEHPFGSIKQWMNQGAFLMKGLDNVRAEFSLTTLVYNLRRALNILGVEAMMASVRG
jgi:DDE family transposase